MKSINLLLVIVLFFNQNSYTQSDKDKPVTLSPRVGIEIDKIEADKFKLFTSFPEFQTVGALCKQRCSKRPKICRKV